MQRGLQSRNGANDSEQDRLHPARHLPQGRYFACWAPSVAEWDERHQEIVLKNDPGCARQGVEVERNRAQTRIALTNDVDRAQRGVFKGFSFFLALWVIFPLGDCLFLCPSARHGAGGEPLWIAPREPAIFVPARRLTPKPR